MAVGHLITREILKILKERKEIPQPDLVTLLFKKLDGHYKNRVCANVAISKKLSDMEKEGLILRKNIENIKQGNISRKLCIHKEK